MKILVNGGTNGMGTGVAKVLAGIDNQIHEVILLCRSKELGEATIRELENSTLYYDASKPDKIGYITQGSFLPNLMYRAYF